MISVIMATYNTEKYAGDAIRSILKQTYRKFNLIIIDDASTDDTSKIVKKYAATDKRITTIFNKKNRGFTLVLNQALPMCKDKYIAIQDSDDYSLPERFEKQVKMLESGKADIVTTWGKTIDKHGKKTANYYTDKAQRKIPVDMSVEFPVLSPSRMYRRKIHDTIGLYDPEMKISQDYNFFLRAMKHYKFFVIPKVLYVKRKHSGSVRARRSKELSGVDWGKFGRDRAREEPVIR